MAFKKGDPKPVNSGRKAGTPHKKSLLVREVLENHGINLAEQILLRIKEVSKEEQLRALIQILPYVYPKLTSADVNLKAAEGFRVIIEDYTTSKKSE